MALPTIDDLLAQRQQQASIPVRLFALFDALMYTRADDAAALERSTSAVALFDGTPDASLADAGPWLVDVKLSPPGMQRTLRTLAAGAGGMSWLISAYGLPSLAHHLRERLDVRMPDGRTALLRFYDARLVGGIAGLLSFSQRAEFFVPTFEWIVEMQGRLIRVHPDA